MTKMQKALANLIENWDRDNTNVDFDVDEDSWSSNDECGTEYCIWFESRPDSRLGVNVATVRVSISDQNDYPSLLIRIHERPEAGLNFARRHLEVASQALRFADDVKKLTERYWDQQGQAA